MLRQLHCPQLVAKRLKLLPDKLLIAAFFSGAKSYAGIVLRAISIDRAVRASSGPPQYNTQPVHCCFRCPTPVTRKLLAGLTLCCNIFRSKAVLVCVAFWRQRLKASQSSSHLAKNFRDKLRDCRSLLPTQRCCAGFVNEPTSTIILFVGSATTHALELPSPHHYRTSLVPAQ